MEALDKEARAGSLHLHIFQPQFVVLSFSPRNPSCDRAINVRVNLTTVSQAKLPLNWPQKSM